MSRPHLPRRPRGDDDPTGMRDILSSLPDPGPMPPDVVERINARLAQERDLVALSDQQSASWSPPASPRSRTRFGLGLAAAAAAVTVAGVLGVQTLMGTINGETSVGVGAADLAPSAHGPAYEAAVAAPEAAASSATHIQLSNTAYTTATLKEKVAQLLATPQPSLRPGAAESTAIGPIGTSAGVSTCLRALGVTNVSHVIVDIGRYNGQPAAILITTNPDGVRQALVAPRPCSDGSTILGGPITLP